MIVGTWLSRVDWDILEFYDEYEGISAPPKVIWYNSRTDAEYNSVSRRARKLHAAGILNKYEDEDNGPTGYYCLSTTGRLILDDDLSREEIEELEPDDD